LDLPICMETRFRAEEAAETLQLRWAKKIKVSKSVGKKRGGGREGVRLKQVETMRKNKKNTKAIEKKKGWQRAGREFIKTQIVLSATIHFLPSRKPERPTPKKWP